MGRSLLALALALAGCSADTQVVVVFDADDALRARAASVHAEVLDGEGAEVGRTDFEVDELPLFGLRLLPRDGDASRRFVVRAELRDADGAVLGEQRVEGRYVDGEAREAWVVFDEVCGGLACPNGYRCQEGRCVEGCVEPTPPEGVTRSLPRACGDACAGPTCEGGFLATCEDGARVVDRVCELGCADASACREPVASNLGVVVGAPDAELGDLVIPGDGFWPVQSAGGEIAGLRDPGDLVGGVRWYEATVDGQTYSVFEMRDLLVEADGVFALNSAGPTILLVHGEARIEGRLQVRGSGSERGSQSDGSGPGAGLAGAVASPSVGGGGGGGFGSPGGDGGDAPGAPGGVGGGTYGTPELVPLIAGSSGGGDGATGRSGDGGGAVQISARVRIVLARGSDVMAHGGRPSNDGSDNGSGGGSGGAVLFEAPEVILEGDGDRIRAGGGSGGVGRAMDGSSLERGAGSGSSEPAGRGRDGLEASGGGGGAGRVRINNADGEGRADYENNVVPSGESVFSVGTVGRAPPE